MTFLYKSIQYPRVGLVNPHWLTDVCGNARTQNLGSNYSQLFSTEKSGRKLHEAHEVLQLQKVYIRLDSIRQLEQQIDNALIKMCTNTVVGDSRMQVCLISGVSLFIARQSFQWQNQ